MLILTVTTVKHFIIYPSPLSTPNGGVKEVATVLSILYDKILDRSNLRKEGFTLAHK